MAGFAGVAEEYFSNLNSIASRIHSDIIETKNAYENLWETLNDVEKSEIVDECIIKPEVAMKYAFLDPLEIEGFNKSDILSYFDIQCGQKVIRDESTKFRDEHSSPFSFHTRSQLDLCSFAEKRVVKQKPKTKPTTPPDLKTELALSHSKVLSELKNALKSNEKFESSETKECQIEFSPKPLKVNDESVGFISKLMGNKRQNKGSAEEREHLVSPGRQCQIVASSDNYFKTNFHSGTVSATETPMDSHKFSKDVAGMKGSAYRSSSGMFIYIYIIY